MTNVKNGNVVINSTTRDVINNVSYGKNVSDDEWIELTTVAAQHGKCDEVRQLRRVETLLKDGKRQEAGHVWTGIRGFFVSMLPHVANIAQIVGTIDELTKHL